MSRRELHLHIERLVLDGFAPGTLGSGARVADGLQRELRRLLAEQVPASWQRGAACERTVGPPLRRAPAAAPERLGEQVAASVYRSFSRGGGR